MKQVLNIHNSNSCHLTSNQTQSLLKINSCDLMHLREAGKLRYEKKGNAYMYLKEDVEEIKDLISNINLH